MARWNDEQVVLRLPCRILRARRIFRSAAKCGVDDLRISVPVATLAVPFASRCFPVIGQGRCCDHWLRKVLFGQTRGRLR